MGPQPPATKRQVKVFHSVSQKSWSPLIVSVSVSKAWLANQQHRMGQKVPFELVNKLFAGVGSR